MAYDGWAFNALVPCIASRKYKLCKNTGLKTSYMCIVLEVKPEAMRNGVDNKVNSVSSTMVRSGKVLTPREFRELLSRPSPFTHFGPPGIPADDTSSSNGRESDSGSLEHGWQF